MRILKIKTTAFQFKLDTFFKMLELIFVRKKFEWRFLKFQNSPAPKGQNGIWNCEISIFLGEITNPNLSQSAGKQKRRNLIIAKILFLWKYALVYGTTEQFSKSSIQAIH